MLEAIPYALAALVFGALATFVLKRRSGSPATHAFGVFVAGVAGVSLSLGLMVLTTSDAAADWHMRFPVWTYPLLGVGAVLMTAGIIGLALRFPTRLQRRDARLILLPVVAALFTFLVVLGVGIPRILGRFDDLPAFYAVLQLPEAVGYATVFGSITGCLVLFALRARNAARGDGAYFRDYAYISAGLLFIWGVEAAFRPFEDRGPRGDTLFAVESLASFLLVAGLWLLTSAQARRKEEARVARNVALLALTIPTVVAVLIVLALAMQGPLAKDTLSPVLTGVFFALGGVILTHAVLRRQILGIDAKIRWGVSRTTVAAIFIAVFFIASEAAQVFFEGRFNNSLMGIIAAGALVFAIAPLQRAADHLAARAVPASDGPTTEAHHKTYREEVRLALADGRINRAEERALARLADLHGLSAAEALAIREDEENAAA